MSKFHPMSRKLCLTCKGGRLLCGRSYCPLLQRLIVQNPIEEKLKEDMFGPSPSIFVGWKGYPAVFMGPMTSLDLENPKMLDTPSMWYGADFDDIIRMRSLLVRSKVRQGVKQRTKFIEKNQELALAVKPADIEVKFKRKPSYSISFSPISQPMGPSGILKKLEIAENPKIPGVVDKVTCDEIRASEALFKLYDKPKFDVYYLTNVLSSGALGLKENKKLVPTRWSITAVDDILARELMKQIRDYPQVNEYTVYTNQYLENHFEILLIPGAWEFEQFEAWAPKTWWTQAYDKAVIVEEHEKHKGRWDYAINEGGGYYAGRFGVCEALDRMRRQARVVIFREIYESYVMPVGVWEVRENVRHAFLNPPKKFNTLKEALEDINTRLTIPVGEYVKKSEILRQRRLSEWA
ncbi:MAG: hypothetical protein A7316_09880 [Candidatus Altiarchaeales archaeon WOR_SM1_86-2]|nr:MAG: hypothetical protein A7316_09880 [Candidatus Altiarchaeales archaeon WOR_SM1_86-2]